MKIIQRIIKPVVLAGAVFIGINLNANPSVSIDSFIKQIDAFISSQTLNPEQITELKTFRDALDKGSLSKGALLTFYAKLCKSGNLVLIKQVDTLATPLMTNPTAEKEFWAQLNQRKLKNAPSGSSSNTRSGGQRGRSTK